MTLYIDELVAPAIVQSC